MKKGYICLLFLLCISLIFAISGCTRRNPKNKQAGSSNTSVNQATEENTDKKAIATIVRIDEAGRTIVASDVDSGWRYPFHYEGSTVFLSRYGENISVTQLEIGQIVDVTYADEGYLCSIVQVSYDAWEYEDVMGLTYDRMINEISVMGEKYKYDASLVLHDASMLAQEVATDSAAVQQLLEGNLDAANVSSDASADSEEDSGEAKKRLVEGNLSLSQISDQDTVTCRGYKGKICSVVLNKGHGIVRLSDYSTYIGGMIAIGNVIKPVTKDMVLTVPAGNWTLEIDKDGKMGTKEIVVSQGQDQTVNLAKLTIIACRRGVMHFNTTPAGCGITIDGKDYEGRTDFMLEYGPHKVSVSAVDYKAYNGVINLNSAYVNINVELTKLEDDSEPSVNTSAARSSTAAPAAAATTTEAAAATTAEAAEAAAATETSENN